MSGYDAVVMVDRVAIVNKSTGQQMFSVSKDGFGSNIPFNGVSNDPTLAGDSQTRVVTEYAAKGYTDDTVAALLNTVVDSLTPTDTSHAYLPSTLCLHNAILSYIQQIDVPVDLKTVVGTGAATLTTASLLTFWSMPAASVTTVNGYVKPLLTGMTAGYLHVVWEAADLTAGNITLTMGFANVSSGSSLALTAPSTVYIANTTTGTSGVINEQVWTANPISLPNQGAFIYIQRGNQYTGTGGPISDTYANAVYVWGAYVRYTLT